MSRVFIAFVLPIRFAILVKESAPLLLQKIPFCEFLEVFSSVFRVLQTLVANDTAQRNERIRMERTGELDFLSQVFLRD